MAQLPQLEYKGEGVAIVYGQMPNASRIFRLKEPAPLVCSVCGSPRDFNKAECQHDVGNVRKCE